MMQCRMCSQRLTRPGKLCRECERELDRARLAAASVDDLGASVAPLDASRMAGGSTGGGWRVRLRSRAPIIAAAFSIGLVSAAAMYVVQRSASATADSVMLDRDVSNLRPRLFAAGVPGTAGIETKSPRDAADTRTSTVSRTERGAQSSSAVEPQVGSTLHRVGMPLRSTSTANETRGPGDTSVRSVAQVREPITPRAAATTVTAKPDAPPTLDRVLALSNALAECAQETFFARLACEHRARTQYCDGVAGRLPQCADETPRDHGQ